MDYIARYGAEGAFTEVAELKLKQLTSQSPGASSAAHLRDAARAAAAEPARPATRNYDSQPRRAESAPSRRPDPPRREPTFDRSHERTPPPLAARELPREGGGGIRMLILVVLLGGAAMAAGLYFGDNASPPTGNEEVASAPEQSAPADAPSMPVDTPDGVGLSELAEQAPPPRATPRTTQARPAPTRTERARAEEPAAPTPTPTPVASWTEPTSGPISLAPGEQTSSAPSVIVPLTPPGPPPVTQVAVSEPPAATPAPTVVWSQRPSADRIAQFYPPRALRTGVGGRAVLDCVVQPSLSLSCVVSSETPATAGFGRAALNAAGAYRAQGIRSDGSTAVGARTRVAITFRPPPQ